VNEGPRFRIGRLRTGPTPTSAEQPRLSQGRPDVGYGRPAGHGSSWLPARRWVPSHSARVAYRHGGGCPGDRGRDLGLRCVADGDFRLTSRSSFRSASVPSPLCKVCQHAEPVGRGAPHTGRQGQTLHSGDGHEAERKGGAGCEGGSPVRYAPQAKSRPMSPGQPTA